MWKTRDSIPNQEGFRLVVKLTNGTIVKTNVVRDMVSGLHSLYDVAITDVLAWRNE